MSELGNQISRDDAEKPFWISYSDLMTALMILFLVVMVASLTSISQQTIDLKGKMDIVKKQLSETQSQMDEKQPSDPPLRDLTSKEEAEMQRLYEISEVCADIKENVEKTISAAFVDCSRNIIDLGESVRFDKGQYVLKAEGKAALRNLVPIVINVARTPMGEKWLKRVQIQGYTDTDGSYLYNLNLSLKRSEWVMCEILAEDHHGDVLTIPISTDDRTFAKRMFLVAGVSFNNQKTDKETSRRVEFKLDFHELGDSREQIITEQSLFKEGVVEKCQI